jgi:hypothetical protein
MRVRMLHGLIQISVYLLIGYSYVSSIVIHL